MTDKLGFAIKSLFITMAVIFTGCQTDKLTSSKSEEEAQFNPLYKTAAFGGKVKNIRVRQRTGGVGYRVTVNVEGTADDIAQIGSVELQFNEPFEGPSPQENPLTLKCVPEKADSDVSAGKCSGTFEGEGSFDDNAIGLSYNVTATMVDPKKGALGEPQSRDVVVENLEDEDEAQDAVRVTGVDVNSLGQGIYQIRIKREGDDISNIFGYAV